MYLEKQCKECGEVKLLFDFANEKRNIDGHMGICRVCAKLYKDKYRLKNKKKIAKQVKEYAKKNKKQIADYKKQYREDNAEAIAIDLNNRYRADVENRIETSKKHYAKNRDKKLIYAKKYYEENNVVISIKTKKYREDNKEHLAQKEKLYRASDAGKKVKARGDAKRELQIRETRDGSITTETLRELMIEQEGCCALCNCDLTQLKKKNQHVDHITPLSKGGKHILENIQWTCANCNLTKGDKL